MKLLKIVQSDWNCETCSKLRIWRNFLPYALCCASFVGLYVTLKVRDQVPSDLLLCDSYLSRTGEFLWICKVGKTLEWLSLIRRPRAAWAAKNINEYLYHFHYDCAKGNYLLQYRFTILICWHHIECMRMSRPPYWRCCLWLSRSLPPPSHPQSIPRHKWQNKITFPTCQCVKNRLQATMPYL